jgi:hypothetical protein
MSMEEYQKKAFDFAADLTKQLITLSTAIITLTVTFSKDIVGNAPARDHWWLLISWVAFIISILFGILTLMGLTGNLDPTASKQKKDNGTFAVVKQEPILTVTSSNVTWTAKIQIITFLIALVCTGWYGYTAQQSKTKMPSRENTYLIIRRSQLGKDSTIYTDTLYLPTNSK